MHMTTQVTPCYVITGSLTEEGSVAYLGRDGSWVRTLAQAHPFETKEEAEGRLAEVKVHQEVITEPYVFVADRGTNGPVPRSAREILRSRGPSTRLRRPD